MKQFERGNIFQSDTVFEKHAGATTTVRCPHCSNLGTFLRHDAGVKYVKAVQNDLPSQIYASLMSCPNPSCHGIVLSMREFYVDSQLRHTEISHFTLPHERIEFDTKSLPENLIATLSESITCCSNGAYRAAAMMARRLLEEICEEANAEGKSLHSRLKHLRTTVILPEALFDAAGEMKLLGNDAAHIEAKHYDNIGKEEAEICIEIGKEILKARYQMKGLVEKIRSMRRTQVDE